MQLHINQKGYTQQRQCSPLTRSLPRPISVILAEDAFCSPGLLFVQFFSCVEEEVTPGPLHG